LNHTRCQQNNLFFIQALCGDPRSKFAQRKNTKYEIRNKKKKQRAKRILAQLKISE